MDFRNSLSALSALFLVGCIGSQAEIANLDGGSVDGTAMDDGSSGDGGSGECTGDSDCVAKLGTTVPVSCANATCDLTAHICKYVAKDGDGDGHAAKTCAASTGVTVQVGDDCDDADKTTYPGAPDVCDGKNHTCGTTACQCIPKATRSCYDGPAATRKVGACKDGTQTCDSSGKWPTTCAGEVVPATSDPCDNTDANCDGNPNTGCSCTAGATQTCNAGLCNPTTVTCSGGTYPSCPAPVTASTYRTDADGDTYCVGNPSDYCPGSVPTNARLASSCASADDCNDGDANIHPNATEICNGVDDNCNGTKDDGFGIGTGCVAGNAGVCKRNGTIQCATSTTTTCSPGPGTAADSDHSAASTDSLIYTGGDNANYIAAWDWGCDGIVEMRPNGLINYNFANPTIASLLCSGQYDAACQQFGPGCATLPVVYPCGLACGNNCTKAHACGHTLQWSNCIDDYNGQYGPAGQCNSYDNPTSTDYCR